MACDDFRELPEHELSRLTDEQLIDYLRCAREKGNEGALMSALGVLVHGYLPNLERRAGLKMKREDAEDVAAEAMMSALKSAFDGNSVGEFRAWLNRILLRRIADFYRARENKEDPLPLPTGHEDDDDAIWGEVPSVEFEGTQIDAHRALKQAFEELSETHQAVVELYIFLDMPAAEVAEQTGESEDNVHQIASRFRKRVRDLLDGDDTSD